MNGNNGQRLDKWIWFARIVRNRQAAAALVESGNVRVNRNRVTKPGYDITIGDVLTISLYSRVRVIEVVEIAERRGTAADASRLYREASMREEDGVHSKNGGAESSQNC